MKLYESELKLAVEAAVKAGEELFRNDSLQVDSNIGRDIKLSSDKQSEKLIIDMLRETKIPILSEECGFISGSEKELRWIVDPLDGTANYYRNMTEMTCVSIALWKNNTPILGVINRFKEKEVYSGIVEVGAWKNGTMIQTSKMESLPESIIATGFPVNAKYDDESLRLFMRQIQNFKKVRMLGSAATMGAFVSDGRVDVYAEEGIMLWDIAAATALVQSAGGVTDITFLEKNRCICKLFANEKLKENYNKWISSESN